MWDNVKPVYRTIIKPMLSKRLLMERMLFEMFVLFHHENHRKPDPDGHYYVAVNMWDKYHVRLELKQTETNIIDTLGPVDGIRKLPQPLVTIWAAAAERGTHGW